MVVVGHERRHGAAVESDADVRDGDDERGERDDGDDERVDEGVEVFGTARGVEWVLRERVRGVGVETGVGVGERQNAAMPTRPTRPTPGDARGDRVRDGERGERGDGDVSIGRHGVRVGDVGERGDVVCVRGYGWVRGGTRG